MPTILHSRRPRLLRELRETLRLAVPLVLGQLSAIGMNVIDALLAGHLDAHTLAAVAIGTSVWSLVIVAAIGVMMALPPSVAQLHGAGRRDAIGPLFRQALWLALALGVGLGLALRFGGALLVGAHRPRTAAGAGRDPLPARDRVRRAGADPVLHACAASAKAPA